MVWNVRGAGSLEFLSMIKEHICIQEPPILALLETHISGAQVDEVCDRIASRDGTSWKHRVSKEVFGCYGTQTRFSLRLYPHTNNLLLWRSRGRVYNLVFLQQYMQAPLKNYEKSCGIN